MRRTSSAATAKVCRVSVPPAPSFAVIASRALTARLTITCSSWPGSARTGPRPRPCLTSSLTRLAEQPVQQVRDLGDHVGQLQDLRAQRLLAREGEQLAGQAGGAVRVGADLLDVVIIAVARRVAHQHQVAGPMIAVRILLKSCATPPASWPTACILVACATCALEPRFLAIVLEAEQDRGIAEPARAGDGHRHRLVRIGPEPHREIARHRRGPRPKRRTASETAALSSSTTRSPGQAGLSVAASPAARAERLVQEQEAAVAVGQREAERKDVEQGVDVGRLVAAARSRHVVEQQEGGERVGSIAGRDLDDPQRRRRPCPRRRTGTGRWPPAARCSTKARALDGPDFAVRAAGAGEEGAVRGEDRAVGVDDRGHHARLAQPAARLAGDQPPRLGGEIGAVAALAAARADGRSPIRATSPRTGTPPRMSGGTIAPRSRRAARIAAATAGRSLVQREAGRRGGAAEPARPGGIGRDQRARSPSVIASAVAGGAWSSAARSRAASSAERRGVGAAAAAAAERSAMTAAGGDEAGEEGGRRRRGCPPPRAAAPRRGQRRRAPDSEPATGRCRPPFRRAGRAALAHALPDADPVLGRRG